MDSSGVAGALKETGVWTYWTEDWVSFKGTVTDDVANITFSNNAGNWYDTQLFYKIPGKNAGATYKVTLHINNVPKAGRITVFKVCCRLNILLVAFVYNAENKFNSYAGSFGNIKLYGIIARR